jgi:hypothetical protein
VIGARAWILLFGGVSFLTGAAAGALSGRGADAPVLDSLQAYGAQLEQSYQLEPERAAALPPWAWCWRACARATCPPITPPWSRSWPPWASATGP